MAALWCLVVLSIAAWSLTILTCLVHDIAEVVNRSAALIWVSHGKSTFLAAGEQVALLVVLLVVIVAALEVFDCGGAFGLLVRGLFGRRRGRCGLWV